MKKKPITKEKPLKMANDRIEVFENLTPRKSVDQKNRFNWRRVKGHANPNALYSGRGYDKMQNAQKQAMKHYGELSIVKRIPVYRINLDGSCKQISY